MARWLSETGETETKRPRHPFVSSRAVLLPSTCPCLTPPPPPPPPPLSRQCCSRGRVCRPRGPSDAQRRGQRSAPCCLRFLLSSSPSFSLPPSCSPLPLPPVRVCASPHPWPLRSRLRLCSCKRGSTPTRSSCCWRRTLSASAAPHCASCARRSPLPLSPAAARPATWLAHAQRAFLLLAFS